ncbi:MAG: LarC family nickel insertion protein, partial [Gemmataceae bacterium]
HGVMPVPAPATANLLRGAPLAASPIKSELTTPTGAAILSTLVQEWVESPAMRLQAIGHGAGMKDFLEQPNLLRVFLGESTSADPGSDQVWHLETNLDDVPGEWIAFAFEQLFSAGALDVFTIPATMKKNRPAVLLNVLVSDAHRSAVEQVIFRETRTFGIRRHLVHRSKLHREEVTLQTPWGPVRGKHGWREGLDVITPEYEDCARIARQHRIPLREVYAKASSPSPPGNSS